jgi:large subunit ribosomal protein L30
MKLAVLMVRGRIGLAKPILDTLDQLGIPKKHSLAVVEDTPVVKGMLQKVKDFVTWGPVSEELIKQLQSKSKDEKKIRCSMHPPRGGYERKGIKTSFQRGGALGNRGEKMEDLVKRML